MNALPYVDQLFKEYLLFRGFTATIQAFNGDLAGDRGQGFQVSRPRWHLDLGTLSMLKMLFQKREC